MSIFYTDPDRNVIPRWRDSDKTKALGELDASVKAPVDHHYEHSDFERRLTEWTTFRTRSFAVELIGAAYMAGMLDHPEVRSAADLLIRTVDDGARSLRAVAGLVVPQAESLSADLGRARRVEVIRTRIRSLKCALIAEPRNILALTNLAREYSIIGQQVQARKYMERARALSAENRFVLRSAARMHIHQNELDRALDLLRRSTRRESDPWLAAAEIAVALASDSKPRSVKIGRWMLESGRYAPLHVAELASALATSELENGNAKKAKKLFRLSLTCPTENAVAQAEWASRRFLNGELLIPHAAAHGIVSFEAESNRSHQAGDIEGALASARMWLEDQPFSSRPAVFGSYLAGILGDHAEAEQLAREGLRANPGDTTLINNLVFSLASQNKIEEAERLVADVRESILPAEERPTWKATQGLIAFRRGEAELGRQLYTEAINMCVQRRDLKSAVRGSLYLAFEELRADTPFGPEAAKAARDAARQLKDPDIDQLINELNAFELRSTVE